MRLAIAIVAVALLLPAAAAAKEVTRLDVCGTNGCTRVTAHDALEAFMQGGEYAAAAPGGAHRSFVVKAWVREGTGRAVHGWTSRWLPGPGLLAYEDEPGQFTFSPVTAKLERFLKRAARGRIARAARTYAERTEPAAQVDEVVTAPPATARAHAGGGLSPLAWVGIAVGLLAVGGAGARGLRRR